MAYEGWEKVNAPRNPARAMQTRPGHRRERRRRPILRWVVGALAILALIGAAGGLLVRDALRARSALEHAVAVIPALEQGLRTDPQSVTQELADVKASANLAANSTTGPLWTLAGYLPVVGDDVRAFQVIASNVDRLASEVLPRFATVAQSITPDALAPVDGRINVEPLVAARDDVVAADLAVGTAIQHLSALNRASLIPQISDAVGTLQGQLVRVRATSATAARAVELLPPMLGADGQRFWLVIAQNNAEQRSTGGIPGAAILVRADHGSLHIENQVSAEDISRALVVHPTLNSTEESIFGPNLARYFQDVNFTPDFPRSADLALQMWAETQGTHPQGVISLDPVALAGILDATGPVSFTDPIGDEVTLTTQNAADFLLREIYQNYPDPEVQNEVFGNAAEAIFHQLTAAGGDLNARALLDAVVAAADAGRVYVWSAIPGEQERIADTVLSGALRGRAPQLDGSYAPMVGVFANLAISGKTGYYLNTTTNVESTAVNEDGSQEIVLRIRFENILPPGAGLQLPDRVVGNGPSDGTIPLNVLVYAPENGEILSVRDGADNPIGVRPNRHDGLAMVAFSVEVAPQTSQEILVDIVSGRGQIASPQLRITPGAR